MEKGQVFGLKCKELLAEYDPNSQSLKMCQPSLIEEESKSLDRLPNQGMMRNGKLYLQNKLELDTSENEYGLWRTPDTGAGGTCSQEMLDYVADNKLRRPSGTLHQLRLQDQVRHPKLFPTPKARDYQGAEGKRVVETKKGWSKIRKKSKVKYGASLNDVVEYMEMFPTPQAIDASAGQGISKNDKLIVKESGVIRKVNKKGNDFGLTLSRHVMIEDQRKKKSEKLGSLNPNWVEWLMGYKIGHTDLEH